MDQGQIQGRMIYTCRLLEGEVDSETAANLDDWYKEVAINGLCGGWVEIFKRDPQWIEAIWRSLTQWDPEGPWENGGERGRFGDEDLKNLQTLLRAAGIGESEHEARQVVRALIAAWEFMDKLEPEADYGEAPNRLKGVAGNSASPVSVKLEEIYAQELDLPPGESAGYFTETLSEETGILAEGADAHYIAHLETRYHHMAVDLRRKGGKRTFMVCETEKSGIVECATLEGVQAVLKEGCAVGYFNEDGSPADGSSESDSDEPIEASGEDTGPADKTAKSDPDYSIKIFSATPSKSS